MILHSECVYDVDNHYIDLEIVPANWAPHAPQAFMLKIIETKEKIPMNLTGVYLRRDDLERIIKDLTTMLDAD